ncbi:vitamin K dependent gamma glutamyl carboxylase [Plakobranchus ocellatus]|uniref:Vitamin K dependent gamma glutamyl carboxylase n=1 Tax=Plakobranchus ocellatus TaxID=259542 RepID=A0AAV3YX64_9GAST|nr:vitamin K dependent gamma glutamyl carboxylase [Plakobranchus ocellatus]
MSTRASSHKTVETNSVRKAKTESTAYKRLPQKNPTTNNPTSHHGDSATHYGKEEAGKSREAAEARQSNGCDGCDTDRNWQTSFPWAAPIKLHDVTSCNRLARLLCRPTDPALLALIRFLFGLLMVLDTLMERGMAGADMRWGDPKQCQFPLINGLKPLPLPWMYVVYLLMVFGASGIMLGLAYRVSCITYMCCYWYIFFLDKTSWNNHSYLFGVLAFLCSITDANRHWSIDALINPNISNAHVPLWNYILFRAQIFLVYTIAGLKKLDLDWMAGYSMQSLSLHWVFHPFRYILTNEQIDLFVVHLGGLTIDLFSGFLLVSERTRPVALLITSMFHIMNAMIFHIGMFPYGMLGLQLIFCNPDLPRRFFKLIPPTLRLLTPDDSSEDCVPSYHCVYTKEDVKPKGENSFSTTQGKPPPTHPNKRHKLVSVFTIAFIGWQCFLPYSHGITKGYNNWTNGLYGYSWDMMVHSWSTQHIRITYRDKDTNATGYLDPMVWSGGARRWAGHADMIKQYANCIADNLKAYDINNVEIYFDIWRSLNSRFHQRAIDPRVDLITADWHPFRATDWSLPLMANLSDWRQHFESTYRWLGDDSSVNIVFVADFPGLFLENYVQPDFGNTSLTVLAGKVVVEMFEPDKNFTLEPGEKMQTDEQIDTVLQLSSEANRSSVTQAAV